MNVKRFYLERAEEERRKAAAADSDSVRKAHEQMARLFEARAAERGAGDEEPDDTKPS